MIDAVIFDFGQTLVNSADGFRSAEKLAEAKLFTDLSLTDWDDFLATYRRIRKSFQGRGNFSRLQAWQELYWQYCRDTDDPLLQQWELEYWQHVSVKTVPFSETADVLETLGKTYRLGVITNTEGQMLAIEHRVHHFPELKKFFGSLVIAGDGDIPAKPSGQAFELCLSELGVTADRAVYVGDDWRMDIGGARDAGLHPIWIRHRAVARNWPDVEAGVPVIESLEPLLQLDALLAAGKAS